MPKKNVWNLHLLDKLYFINHQDKCVNDTPIMKLEIVDRDIIINGFTLRGDNQSATFILNNQKNKLFFNKEDADTELETWKFSLKTPIQ